MNNSDSDVKPFRVVAIDAVMWKWINGCLGDLHEIEWESAAAFCVSARRSDVSPDKVRQQDKFDDWWITGSS